MKRETTRGYKCTREKRASDRVSSLFTNPLSPQLSCVFRMHQYIKNSALYGRSPIPPPMCKKIKAGINYGPVLGSSGSSKSVTKHGQGSMGNSALFLFPPKRTHLVQFRFVFSNAEWFWIWVFGFFLYSLRLKGAQSFEH